MPRVKLLLDKGKADNDELNKSDWTNWCGTSAMTTDVRPYFFPPQILTFTSRASRAVCNDHFQTNSLTRLLLPLRLGT